ncbi:penicillin-binding protein 1A [Nitrospira sp.]|nr:penicillin-binding protein 1A [Nitrospira sp.]
MLAGLGCAVLGASAAVGTLWYFAQDLPALDMLETYQPSQVTRVYSDDRQLIGQFFIERRIVTPLVEMPKNLINAVIAVEDARFFEHPGLDFVGIARAAVTNLRRRGRVEGASTITQQLARSLFLSSERTFSRKVKELILAYKMELILSKEQILELYLNQIYFGQGAYGVAAATDTYFGKELKDLTLPEAALLAGLPKSPNHYSPLRSPERAKKRQEHVLGRMEEAGFITPAEREAAINERLVFRRLSADSVAPYFVEYVRQYLVGKYGESAAYKGGMEIYTTLNLDMQQVADQAIRDGLRELDKRQGWRGPVGTTDPTQLASDEIETPLPNPGEFVQGVVTKATKDHFQVQVGNRTARLAFEDMAWAQRQLVGRDPTKDFKTVSSPKHVLKPGDVIEVSVKKVERNQIHVKLEQEPVVEGALVALDPASGAVRAMVGGYDFSRSEYNRAVMAHRQPGSAFKPIIYAAALAQGLGPASVVLDAPVVYEDEEEEKIWKPENYGRRFHGVVSLREALTHSHNLATVRLLDKIGIKNVVEFAKAVGVTSPLAPDLSLALGSSSVSLMELTSVYGVFGNQGTRVDPYVITMVKDKNGQVLEEAQVQPRQVVSKETAYLITNMMEDVIQRGTGQLAKSIGRPMAGKTGTSNEYTNAWFIGMTPNLAVGTYVGFDDRRPLGETESGAHAALPIWVRFMQQALQQLPVVPFEIPEDIMYVKVDHNTGLLADDTSSEHTSVELFARGTEPTQTAAPRLDPADFYRQDLSPDVFPSPQPVPAPVMVQPSPDTPVPEAPLP